VTSAADRQQPLLRRHAFTIGCLLIAAVTFTAFLPSLSNGFVNRDDPAYVTDNLAVRGFTPAHLAKIFSSTCLCHYLPVTMLTYMAEYRLFGLDPAAFHRTNLLLHIVNALLVFALLYGLGGNYAAALIGALLFAVHPLRVEPVAWIAERKELLSACFYLASLLLYLSYRKRGRRTAYLLCLGSFLVSLLSKSMSVSQPLVLLLVDYLSGRNIDRKALIEKIPFFALSAVFAVVALLGAQGFIRSYAGYPIAGRLLLPTYAMMFYLVKTIVPVRLCASYYLPQAADAGLTLRMGLSLIGIAGPAAVVFRRRRGSRKPAFGALFFFVTLLPVLQIVNSGGMVLVADRYTYVPIVGICFLVSAALAFLTDVKFKNNRAMRGVLYILMAVSIAALSCLTRQRCAVWKNSLTLWNSIVLHEPAAPQAYNGRGGAYRDAGEYDAALADFGREIALKPDDAGGWFGRGYVYCACLGRVEPALADLREAVRLGPDAPDAWNTLGIANGMSGSCDTSFFDFGRALALKPDFPEAYVNRAYAWIQCFKEFDRARNDCSRALALDPGMQKAWLLRGMAGFMRGDNVGAIPDLDKAIKLDPVAAEAYYYRGSAYGNLGLPGRALADLTAAIDLNPRYVDAYNRRGIVYGMQGRYDRAIDDFNAVMELDPGSAPAAQRNRDIAMAKWKNEPVLPH
jgi:tetratricopeptide (TPR) repeat protein